MLSRIQTETDRVRPSSVQVHKVMKPAALSETSAVSVGRITAGDTVIKHSDITDRQSSTAKHTDNQTGYSHSVSVCKISRFHSYRVALTKTEILIAFTCTLSTDIRLINVLIAIKNSTDYKYIK